MSIHCYCFENHNIINKVQRNILRIHSFILYNWRFYKWGRLSILTKPDLLINPNQISIGRKVEIRKGSRIEAIGKPSNVPKLIIGDGTSIHNYFHCGAAESVIIGKNVLIAGRVYITDHDHVFDSATIPPIFSGLNVAPVSIGDEVWIGEGAAILKGVSIGRRSVIGANAVVTKNIPPFSIAVGVPAKVIRTIEFQR